MKLRIKPDDVMAVHFSWRLLDRVTNYALTTMLWGPVKFETF